MIPRSGWCVPTASILALAVAAAGSPAEAQEGRPFQVVVRPGDQSWSIGDTGARGECSPVCVIHLAPRSYKVTMGDASTEVYLDGPSEISYRAPVRGLQYGGGALAVLGIGGGIAMTYLATQSCVTDSTTGVTPSTCSGSAFSNLSPAGNVALIGTAAGLFTGAVVGGILFFLGGESIRVRSTAAAKVASSIRFDASPQAGWVGLTTSF